MAWLPGLYEEGKRIMGLTAAGIEARSGNKQALKQETALVSRLLAWQANFEYELGQATVALETAERALDLAAEHAVVAQIQSLQGKLLHVLGRLFARQASAEQAAIQ